jgi:hypothetical protein
MSLSKMNPILLLISIISIWGCYKKPDIVLPNGEKCFQGEALKKVKDQRGMIVYSEQDSTYAIQAGIPGSYDSVDIGYLCEESDILKQPGTFIKFSGRYYKYTKEQPLTFVGFTYYYLDITDYQVVE